MRVVRWLLVLLSAGGGTAAGQQSDEATTNPFAQAKFVPDISLILDVSYLERDIENDALESLFMPGFTSVSPGVHGEGHEHGATHRGFNLNYAELVLASVVDPYFDLLGVFHLAQEGFGIEEAFFTTRRLPWGLQVKGGKFLSHFGRINEQHSHYWDFSDPPLVYATFYGDEMLNELGARLTWVPPLDWYLMLGGEVLQGANEMSFGDDQIVDAAGNVVADENAHPSLLVTYAKTSVDVGNVTVLAGVSSAVGKARIDQDFDDPDGGLATEGTTTVVGADVTCRYLLSSFQYIGLQAEYLYRRIHGDRFASDGTGSVVLAPLEQRQGGLYTQLTARFSKRWRAGLRYDLLPQCAAWLDASEADSPCDLDRIQTMIEYNPTEFSRLRLQYGFDRSKYEMIGAHLERRPIHEIALQVNITIGAHGAHSF